MVKMYLTENKTLMYCDFNDEQYITKIAFPSGLEYQPSGTFIVKKEFTLDDFNNLVNILNSNKTLGLNIFKDLIKR